ncbi:MAG: hypothetical protein K2X47_08500, partial [Bdellovibrionales bacterium]|nr:hypothetical protein [Bdellovibrionales bacterium]
NFAMEGMASMNAPGVTAETKAGKTSESAVHPQVPTSAPALEKRKQESLTENQQASPERDPQEKGLRSNFSETAFFLPHLVLGGDGTVAMEFQVPDSVTSWKVMALALTSDLKSGTIERQTQSIKELMVRPAVPRFLREGDTAELKVTVNNSSEKELSGELTLAIERPGLSESANDLFQLKNTDLKKKFKVGKGSSQTVTFILQAPKLVDIFAIRVIAKSGGFSDGELRPFPVLPSRIHLAQSRFVTLKNSDQKVMEFKELAQKEDPTRINEKLVVNVDGQLFYGVLQALPYLVDYPYECAEQTLNRFVSTGILTSLLKKYPAMEKMAKRMSSRKEHLERFDDADPNRKMTLEESPWLPAAQGNLGQDQQTLLRILDSNVAAGVREKALARLKKMQANDGSFPWFDGGKPDQYMTTYILMGLGRALEFRVEVPKDVVTSAFRYLKGWLDSELEQMMSRGCCWELVTLINFSLGQFPDSSWSLGLFDEKFRTRLMDYSFATWKSHSPLLKGYLALTLHRAGRKRDAAMVWESVMDSAKSDPELGTYWAAEDRSWLWYNDTIETHAFSLRTLMELNPNHKKLEGLTQWLFLNKKLNHWKSTRATAEAIYAMAYSLDRSGALGTREVISVDTGTQKTQFVFEPDTFIGKRNQIFIPGSKIDPLRNSKIIVEKQTPGLAFASSTWHFSTDQLPADDRGDFFNISRKYFLRELKGSQWTLKHLGDGEPINVGDQIEVQISIRTKHEAEYVHLRDPRAAGLEPENLTSGQRWDLGISWYEELRDSGSNFYFSKLPVGQYTFKYRLRANMAGNFRVGPATIQSMYAPEFNAYSSGTKLSIK